MTPRKYLETMLSNVKLAIEAAEKVDEMTPHHWVLFAEVLYECAEYAKKLSEEPDFSSN